MIYQNFCLLGTHAYFGDNVQFAILMDERPWKVYYADHGPMGWLEGEDVKNSFELDHRWNELEVDGRAFERLFRKVDPWHWRKDTDVFKQENINIPCDGPMMDFIWKNGNRFKDIGYWCIAYDNVEKLPEYRKLEELIRWLEDVFERSNGNSSSDEDR